MRLAPPDRDPSRSAVLQEPGAYATASPSSTLLRPSVHGRTQFMIAEADVSNEDEVKDLSSRTVKKFRRLDVLVNNAGVVAEGDVG